MLVLTFKAPSNLKIQPRDHTFCALSLPFSLPFCFSSDDQREAVSPFGQTGPGPIKFPFKLHCSFLLLGTWGEN